MLSAAGDKETLLHNRATFCWLIWTAERKSTSYLCAVHMTDVRHTSSINDLIKTTLRPYVNSRCGRYCIVQQENREHNVAAASQLITKSNGKTKGSTARAGGKNAKFHDISMNLTFHVCDLLLMNTRDGTTLESILH